MKKDIIGSFRLETMKLESRLAAEYEYLKKAK